MDLTQRTASPGYFEAAGTPLIAGRLFTPRDNRGYDDKHLNIGPVLISQSAAREAPVEPMIYLPLFDGDDIYIVAHTVRNPETTISVLQSAIHRLDPDLPVHYIRTPRQIAAESTAGRQFSLVLFAGLAVVLGAVGLYGVVSYAVSRCPDEIGIQMALGANRAGISRMILLQGMKPAFSGIVIGLVGAVFLTRTLQTMLFGVGAIDPVMFAAVLFVLPFVVALACTVPAYRASRIDPMTALRTE